MSSNIAQTDIGWQFDNSYARLPEHFYTRMHPLAVQQPQLVLGNEKLANALGLCLEQSTAAGLAAMFAGNILPRGAQPIAQAYAGHQFGHFTMLGDGRAHLIGEHITPTGERFDIQLKGSGQTQYGRRGDGRAALGPMLREYIISEAMHALGIPSTRSLAVVTTGETIYRQTAQQGAILTRVASSHIRIGTFEYASRQDHQALQCLADYTLWRHYPDLQTAKQPYIELLRAVMHKQIKLIAQWLRVGFIHGVMNTDNIALSGQTIDYGPCAFMDHYDPNTVFSSIDHMGRYAYANQPQIALWNLARFADALLPLLHTDTKQAISIAETVLLPFNELFQQEWLRMMRCKLGLFGETTDDADLSKDLLTWMQQNTADYTNTFHVLRADNLPNDQIYQTHAFTNWYKRWQTRLAKNQRSQTASMDLMQANNPAIIPRNHCVEKALKAAEEADFTLLQRLLSALAAPYTEQQQYHDLAKPSDPSARTYQTFCGT